MLVFVLTGVWHGANWTFLLWGGYHGAWLLFERSLGLRNLDSEKRPALRRATTLFIVMMGWVLFRAPDLSSALDYYRALFSFDGVGLDAIRPLLITRVWLTLVVAAVGVALLPRSFVVGPELLRTDSRLATAGRTAVMVLAFPSALLLVASGSFSPFLYFQF